MIDRRGFIIATGMTALAATRVFGANEKIRLGLIGAGERMKGLIDSANKASPCEIVAVSDVYGPHRDLFKERSGGLATTHLDYREVLDNKDVDAVIIAVARSLAPPHGARCDRGRQGRVSGETRHPQSRGRPGADKAVRSSKQVLQCGMQQRSWAHFRDAVDLVQGGSLGRVVQVRTYWWQNYHTNWPHESGSISRRSIGKRGWAQRRSNRSATRSSATGAGSGTSAAAP